MLRCPSLLTRKPTTFPFSIAFGRSTVTIVAKSAAQRRTPIVKSEMWCRTRRGRRAQKRERSATMHITRTGNGSGVETRCDTSGRRKVRYKRRGPHRRPLVKGTAITGRKEERRIGGGGTRDKRGSPTRSERGHGRKWRKHRNTMTHHDALVWIATVTRKKKKPTSGNEREQDRFRAVCHLTHTKKQTNEKKKRH